MATSLAIQPVAASFDDGASARLATSANSTRSAATSSMRRRASRERIAVSIPTRRHSPSSAKAPPNGRDSVKLRPAGPVAASTCSGLSSRDSAPTSRPIAARSSWSSRPKGVQHLRPGHPGHRVPLVVRQLQVPHRPARRVSRGRLHVHALDLSGLSPGSPAVILETVSLGDSDLRAMRHRADQGLHPPTCPRTRISCGTRVGQVACSPESGRGGELAAAQTLAAALDDRGLLADSVFTADAGFTARELAAELRSRGAHWILRVKGNQKMLHARLKALPWAQVPEAARVRSVGHGRVESRTIRVIDLTGSSDGHGEFFPDAHQALKIIRRRRDRHGRWSVETVYAITSLDARQAEPALLATWVRGHWSIEACLHWVRDVTFGEDHSQVRTDHGPTNLAALRTLAINALRLTGHTNIAADLRKHARTPLLPLVTLGFS